MATINITPLAARWQKTGFGTWAAMKNEYRLTVVMKGTNLYTAYVGGISVGCYETLARAKAAAKAEARR